MTLKGIHIVFIIASDLLSIFFGIWALHQYNMNQSLGYLTTSVVCFLAAIGLMIYGIKFNQKIKI